MLDYNFKPHPQWHTTSPLPHRQGAALTPRPAKASRASKRQLCLLAAISGIIKVARERVGDPRLRQLLDRADRQAQQTTERWAVTGDEQAHLAFAAQALVAWDEQIAPDTITITGSVALALHLVTDLEALVTHRCNKERINRMFAPIQTAYDWLDEQGANWPAIEWAEGLANRLYQLVGEE